MPLEGHYQRVNTPLRRLTARERKIVIAVVTVTFVALGAMLLATAGDSRPAPGPGCIETVVAGRVGGEPVNGCGAKAEAICNRATHYSDPRAEKIVATCQDAGIDFHAAPPPTAGQG